MGDEAIETEYLVVKNEEDQYSIWLAHKQLPDGWHAVGTRGTKTHCLEYIAQTWSDMRPRSLREAMDKAK